MADTKPSRANGKYVESGAAGTGGEILESRQAPIVNILTREVTYQKQSQESIDPQVLYEFYSPESKAFQVDVPIALISRALGDSLERLRLALTEVDQLEKENYISVAWSGLKKLARYVGTWSTFDDALSLLFTSFETHKTQPYNVKELVALQKVLEMLRRKPIPSEDDIDTIFEVLQDTGFDLDAPFAGVDLGDDAAEA